MYSEPCAKLTIRVTPNTSVSPLETMNREERGEPCEDLDQDGRRRSITSVPRRGEGGAG
jgi:hypothetical protein